MVAHELARQLFAPPGTAISHTRHLLAQAAGAHARLLASANAARQEPLMGLRQTLDAYLRSSAASSEKRFVLDHPEFIEALHALTSTSDYLDAWDRMVALPDNSAQVHDAALGCGRLGNVVVAILLRQCRQWRGRVVLATDDYGRVHLPFCDWVLVLMDRDGAGRSLLSHRTICLDLDEREASWSLPDRSCSPLVRMSRRQFDRMFIDNRDDVHAADICFGAGPPWSRFERASRLGHTRIRFEPIGGDAPGPHAELIGGIALTLLGAIEQNAPPIHQQLCQCICAVHGFELPDCASGSIASFSVPSAPGIIGFNVQFTSLDEPRLSPYAFMWLGHELGHTLHYLIDDVAYSHGWQFLENPTDLTPIIPRYGRRLHVRTVFQVPYVHLFEWWLLMFFHERRFAGLPWKLADDSFAVGDELRSEICEAFDVIEQCARLTSAGQAVLVRLRELVAEADSHWRQLAGARPKTRRTDVIEGHSTIGTQTPGKVKRTEVQL